MATPMILSSMPAEDRKALETLFRYLVQDGDFAYVLFGNKPMSFSDFYMDLDLGIFFDKKIFSTIYNGWLTWQKYKKSLFSNSFVILDHVNDDYTIFGFTLYHKERVQALLDKHGSLINPIFTDIDQMKAYIAPLNFDAIQSNGNIYLFHQAVGLLLGYDAVSAKAFRDRFELRDSLMAGPFDLKGLATRTVDNILLELHGKKTFLANKSFNPSHAIEQLNELSAKMKAITLSLRDISLSPVQAPRYMTMDGTSQEVLTRQKNYDGFRDKILEIYFSNNFLEIVLSRLQS